MTLLHPHDQSLHTQHRATPSMLTSDPTPPKATTMTTAQEVPEMTLSALLAADVFLRSREGIPCQQEDPELWFAEAPDDVEFAKALCGTCPVQQECLAGALERREPWGVWGGELLFAGAVVARKRPRGRPRKDAAAVHAQTLRAAEASVVEVLAARAS